VAGFTKSHEITLLVASAFGEREDVVYLFSWSKPAFFLTLFTKRMRFDVAVTDAFPSTTISFIGEWVTFILVVMFIHYLLMLSTVLLTFSKPTAAGISTRTLWFVGHHFTSLLGIEKALQDEPTRLGIYSISLII
jgi:hypothetical protein